MQEPRYQIFIDNQIYAQNMDIETATILVKALFATYFNEHNMIISIKEMEHPEHEIN